MTTFTIHQNLNNTYNITGSHNTWILKEGDQVVSNFADGIYEAASLSDNNYIIKGTVSASGIMVSSMVLSGDDAGVRIAKSGAVEGRNGIMSYGDKATITNSGTIHVDETGVEIHGSHSSMINHGTISSDATAALSVLNVDTFRFTSDGTVDSFRGIYSEAHNLIVNLGKDSVFYTADVGIETMTAYDETAKIVNKGEMSADGNIFSLVIEGHDGNETVRNSGTIDGSISLGGSTDIYNGRGGHVTGVISGGDGPDRYFLDNKKDYVFEGADQGYDQLTVSFSMTLGNDNHIETIHLSGKGNFNLHGNNDANALFGNSGNNSLLGDAGNDWLRGGRGTDLLTGGEGADIFEFVARDGKEIITDFLDGIDTLQLDIGSTHDIASVQDLLAHHVHQDGTNVVISGDGTTMIIRNFDRSDLTIADFTLD
jgi:Ca2+-binding RTX toxin-like protein